MFCLECCRRIDDLSEPCEFCGGNVAFEDPWTFEWQDEAASESDTHRRDEWNKEADRIENQWFRNLWRVGGEETEETSFEELELQIQNLNVQKKGVFEQRRSEVLKRLLDSSSLGASVDIERFTDWSHFLGRVNPTANTNLPTRIEIDWHGMPDLFVNSGQPVWSSIIETILKELGGHPKVEFDIESLDFILRCHPKLEVALESFGPKAVSDCLALRMRDAITQFVNLRFPGKYECRLVECPRSLCKAVEVIERGKAPAVSAHIDVNVRIATEQPFVGVANRHTELLEASAHIYESEKEVALLGGPRNKNETYVGLYLSIMATITPLEPRFNGDNTNDLASGDLSPVRNTSRLALANSLVGSEPISTSDLGRVVGVGLIQCANGNYAFVDCLLEQWLLLLRP